MTGQVPTSKSFVLMGKKGSSRVTYLAWDVGNQSRVLRSCFHDVAHIRVETPGQQILFSGFAFGIHLQIFPPHRSADPIELCMLMRGNKGGARPRLAGGGINAEHRAHG